MKSPCTAPCFPAKGRFTSGPRGGTGGGVGRAVEDSLWIAEAEGWTWCRRESSGLRAGHCYRPAIVGRGGPDPSPGSLVGPAVRSPGPEAPGSLPQPRQLHGETHLAWLLLLTAFLPPLPSMGSLSFPKTILESGVCQFVFTLPAFVLNLMKLCLNCLVIPETPVPLATSTVYTRFGYSSDWSYRGYLIQGHTYSFPTVERTEIILLNYIC